MTTYCTQADLVDRYGEAELIQLTDRAAPRSHTIDPEPVTRACEDATAIIDSYARTVVVVPLVAANVAVVLPYACDLARWLLHIHAHPEHVEHGYEAAMRFLRDLAAGKLALPDMTPPGGSDGSAFGIAVSAPAAVFTSALLGAMP